MITEIEEGKYDKPVATFEDGSKLSLNGTNVGTLIRAFGKNDEDWIGQTDRALRRHASLQRQR